MVRVSWCSKEKEYEFDHPNIRSIDISDFPSFTYNYVDMTYNMEDVLPNNTLCRLSMRAGDYTYEEFPYFYSLYINREKAREEVEKKSKEQVPGTDNKSRDAAFADAGYSINMPVNFTLNFSPITVTQSINVDFRKQLLSANTTLAWGTQGASQTGSRLREEAKEYNSTAFELRGNIRRKEFGIRSCNIDIKIIMSQEPI